MEKRTDERIKLSGISTGDGEIHDFSNSCFITLYGKDKPEYILKVGSYIPE
jgi:hypothetical protein